MIIILTVIAIFVVAALTTTITKGLVGPRKEQDE
jgi:hypothetical protein